MSSDDAVQSDCATLLYASRHAHNSIMYEPLTLPAISREPSKPSDVSSFITEMNAIRARRARLEALTVSMRSPAMRTFELSGGLSYLARSRATRSAPFSASKIRRQQLVSTLSATSGVRLEPLGVDSPRQVNNMLDQQRCTDPLLRPVGFPQQHIAKEEDKDDLDEPDDEAKVVHTSEETDIVIRNFESDSEADFAPESILNSYSRRASAEGDVSAEGGVSGGRGFTLNDQQSAENEEGDLEEYCNRAKTINIHSSEGDREAEDPKLEIILKQLRSTDASEQLCGATAAREQLSGTDDPPTDRYLAKGVLPLLLAALEHDDSPALQLEALWALTNIAAGSHDHTLAIIDAEGVPPIQRLLSSSADNVSLQALWALSNVVGDSAVTRDTAVRAGLLPHLTKIVNRHTTAEAERIMAWTFSNLLRFKPNSMDAGQRMECLMALRHYLGVDDDDARVDAARGLQFASDDDNSHIQQVLDADMLPELLELLQSADYRLLQVGVKIVGNIVSGSDEQTETVVQAGAVPFIVSLLRDDEEAVQKEAAWALSNVLAGTEAQVDAVLEAGGLETLLYLLETEETSDRVGKEVGWCLSNLCVDGSVSAVQRLASTGGVEVMLRYCSQRQDAELTPMMLGACRSVLERISKVEVIAETLLYEEAEQFLKPFTDGGDQTAVALWRDMRWKVYGRDA